MPKAPLTLAEVSAAAAEISDIYAGKYAIARDDDWFLIKLQEELGELAQAHLRLSSRGRGEATEHDRADEAADVLCMLLLYCRRFDIDPEAAVRRKWLTWLEPVA
ncbi:phosphoribosyl-ATP pyrophosphohydrolase [uncultured Phenylobacterium sp.]|uniref:phosphoribosyl-ATP pyrophosphohydrolase n=1 Tax=uncultured Phenylobacterium sp. TaxID=349273 RepID=UPI0025DBB51B|nr:phosphoribosyl-ATP pyrophosphohydrolase [uncultured Phenylobacterium sp.]